VEHEAAGAGGSLADAWQSAGCSGPVLLNVAALVISSHLESYEKPNNVCD
jgi:hypothetical protein